MAGLASGRCLYPYSSGYGEVLDAPDGTNQLQSPRCHLKNGPKRS